MNKTKCKLTAIILITVIFASIFFIGSNDLNKMNAEIYPALEITAEDGISFVEQINQTISWSKNIILRFDIKYILLSIAGVEESNGASMLRHKGYAPEICFYSVLIVVFTNKKDGKKDNMFICYHG